MRRLKTYLAYCGDCLEVMDSFPESCVDSIITDPPYGLKFMGKQWDHGVPGVPFWQAALRVAKPGASLLAFGGTRTHHRLMVAIEDAGWEIRDCLMWLYGTGFPKSHDISKAIDKAASAERKDLGQSPNWRESKRDRERFGSMEVRGDNAGRITTPATPEAEVWNGWGTAIKPSWEPIVLAQKPRDGTFANNALTHGVAGLNIDGCRIPTDDNLNGGTYSGGKQNPILHDDRGPQGAGSWGEDGRLQPEDFIQPSGRWPANLILDPESAAMLDAQTGDVGAKAPVKGTEPSSPVVNVYNDRERVPGAYHGDSGGASRFFYCAKASRSERGEYNKHPTVKPLALMRWLCRLTATPTGGVVLDPFAGSGSTIVAALLEGRQAVAIDVDPRYLQTLHRRINEWTGEIP